MKAPILYFVLTSFLAVCLAEKQTTCWVETRTSVIPLPTPTYDSMYNICSSDSIDPYEVPQLPGCPPLPKIYSGLLEHDSQQLNGTVGKHKMYFWYSPSEKKSNDFVIWLNGGPGCSSLSGQFLNNGPVRFDKLTDECELNPWRWSQDVDILYIDQPGNTGFSYGLECLSAQQAMDDLYAFLLVFAEKFPAILEKDVHVAGGVWGSYLVDAILYDNNGKNHKKLPLKIKTLDLGNALIGHTGAHELISLSTWLHQEPALSHMKYDKELLAAFNERDEISGSKQCMAQVKYPPDGPIASSESLPQEVAYKRSLKNSHDNLSNDSAILATLISEINQQFQPWDSLNPIFHIYLNFDKYHVGKDCFNIYDVTLECKDQPIFQTYWGKYLERDDVRKALHVESSPGKFSAQNKEGLTDMTGCNSQILSLFNSRTVQPPSYYLLPKFIKDGIKVNLFSGRRDMAMNHLGTELVIQNTTWAGKQGFQTKPSRPLGEGNAIYHEERGLSYTLFNDAGHVIGLSDPKTFYYWFKKVFNL